MHVSNYFDEVSKIAKMININEIENLAQQLNKLRERNGRLFLLGVGGSAANCSHAVNDFRKLCNIEIGWIVSWRAWNPNFGKISSALWDVALESDVTIL